MPFNRKVFGFFVVVSVLFLFTVPVFAGGDTTLTESTPFPRPLDSYGDAKDGGVLSTLLNRAKLEPFNVVASLIFLLAIIHSFLTSRFLNISHKWKEKHKRKIKDGKVCKDFVSKRGEIFHFLGEIEAVFGIWAIALLIAITVFFDWPTALRYITRGVNFTEPLFVVVIMTLAATRPILKLAENMMWKVAEIFKGTLTAWWFTILTLGTLLGSFITEPAAMTISALLLSKKFYELEPKETFKYATLGLLFVNISVGGTLSHFAAPPVLMVCGPWDWGMGHMILNFGWKAALGIIISNALYFLIFKKELKRLQKKFCMLKLKDEIQKKYLCRTVLEAEFDKLEWMLGDKLGFFKQFEERAEKIKKEIGKRVLERHNDIFVSKCIDMDVVNEAFEQRFDEIKKRKMRLTIPGLMRERERPVIRDPEWDKRDDDVPFWVIAVHLLFMAWTIYNAHHPPLFLAGLLFFLGFSQVTVQYQNRINLKPPLLVGFFLGGLVVHGGVQGWWISPVLQSFGDTTLMISASILTSFNDNAAITFLSTLVPCFTEELKYAVVAGAVAGGGLTIIANAPNPAGQSILKGHFKDGISPVQLLKGALIPTIVMILCFLVLE